MRIAFSSILLGLCWFAVVNVVYIQLHEEPGLLKRFGARYAEYRERVPRWWPALPPFVARRSNELDHRSRPAIL